MHGVKRLFAWMIPRFDQSRFEVSLLSLRKKDLSEDNLESLGFPVYYLEKGKFDPSTLPALISLLKKLEIDVIQTHGYGATTFGRMAARFLRNRKRPPRARQPDRHSLVPEDPRPAPEPGHRRRHRRLRVDARILYSRAEALARAGEEGLPRRAARRVHSALARGAAGGARDARVSRPDEKIVGTVTRLMESKGNRYLVEAASILAGKRSDVKFVVVGEGPLQSELEAQARALGVSGSGDAFSASSATSRPAFAAFDVAVFPSLWEGTPLTVFEAMAMKKPIVATSVDGLRDVLRSDDNALIVPPKDAGALALSLERALDDTALASRLSERALQTSRRFDIADLRPQDGETLRAHRLSLPVFRRRRPRWDYGKDFAFLEDAEEPRLSSLRESRAVSS